MILRNGSLSEENICLDSGFYFGRGVFETILVKKRPILLREHIQRLNSGLSTIGLNKKITEEEVCIAVEKLNCNNAVLKIMVSEKNTVVSTREISYKGSDYEKGFSLGLSEVRRNAHSNLTYVKSFNYIENVIERDKIINKGHNEALFLNTEGFISEGAVSNIFFEKKGIIYTPSVKCGLLPGIIRGFIIENALSAGTEIVEGEFALDELMSAEGIFITNSIMGIMNIREIENKAFSNSKAVAQIKGYYDRYVEDYE